jgi:hypothetical protein
MTDRFWGAMNGAAKGQLVAIGTAIVTDSNPYIMTGVAIGGIAGYFGVDDELLDTVRGTYITQSFSYAGRYGDIPINPKFTLSIAPFKPDISISAVGTVSAKHLSPLQAYSGFQMSAYDAYYNKKFVSPTVGLEASVPTSPISSFSVGYDGPGNQIGAEASYEVIKGIEVSRGIQVPLDPLASLLFDNTDNLQGSKLPKNFSGIYSGENKADFNPQTSAYGKGDFNPQFVNTDGKGDLGGVYDLGLRSSIFESKSLSALDAGSIPWGYDLSHVGYAPSNTAYRLTTPWDQSDPRYFGTVLSSVLMNSLRSDTWNYQQQSQYANDWQTPGFLDGMGVTLGRDGSVGSNLSNWDEVKDFLKGVGSLLGNIGFSFSFPIILDLDGTGVEITELRHSTTFMDSSGDGLQHRTAWAAAGNGVLFFDPDGRNAITEDRQYIFTKWDPTAADDMAALRGAFDTNGDGKLTNLDTDFAKFKLLVSNADGSTTVQTLAQLNITEINLRSDATNIVLPDGSVITGQTTFTKVVGAVTTTGTVANTTLAAERQGYKLDQSITTDAGGNRVVDIKAYAATGEIAFASKTVTSPTGALTTITHDDNGDGVWDRIQSITKVTNGDLSKTTTVTTKIGGVDAAAITVNVEQTTISADNKIITINRDSMGGGWFDQSEVRTTNANGSVTTVISDLAKSGAVLHRQTENVSIDGSVRTEVTDENNDNVADTTVNHTITTDVNGIRTEIIDTRNGASLLHPSQTIVTSANGKSKTIKDDSDGNGSTDTQTETLITGNAGAATVSTITVKNNDGTTRSVSTVTQSADALTKTTESDSDFSNGVESKLVETTTIALGVRTESSVLTNKDGTFRDKHMTVLQADKVTLEEWQDLNQNGVFEATDKVHTVAVNTTTQERVDTMYNRAVNGSTISTVATTTSANGLIVSQVVDADGDGLANADTKILNTTVLNSTNNSTETIVTTNRDGSTRGSVRIDTVSTGNAVADGYDTKLVTQQTDIDGVNGFDSKIETRLTKATSGAWTEQVTQYAANDTILSRNVTAASADRLLKTTTVDNNGDGGIDQSVKTATAIDGSSVTTQTDYVSANIASHVSITTTSANGLSATIQDYATGDIGYVRRRRPQLSQLWRQTARKPSRKQPSIKVVLFFQQKPRLSAPTDCQHFKVSMSTITHFSKTKFLMKRPIMLMEALPVPSPSSMEKCILVWTAFGVPFLRQHRTMDCSSLNCPTSMAMARQISSAPPRPCCATTEGPKLPQS